MSGDSNNDNLYKNSKKSIQYIRVKRYISVIVFYDIISEKI